MMVNDFDRLPTLLDVLDHVALYLVCCVLVGVVLYLCLVQVGR